MRRREFIKLVSGAAATMPFALSASPGGETMEVEVLASTAIKTALEALAPEFEHATKHKLVITFGASGRLRPEIEAGRAFNLAILSASVVDALVKRGKLVASTRVVIARSGAGIAVRKGVPRTDVSTTETVKRALLGAKSLGYSETGATGQFLMAMFERLGITNEMKPKLILSRPGKTSLQALADGEIDLSIPQISEALAAPGVELLGPLPPELQVYTVLSAAVATMTEDPDGAKALLEFLRTPAAIAVLKAKGLDPGASS
jgi:molybdate transport system substrate-binding protein